jgi:hypothetical protein
MIKDHEDSLNKHLNEVRRSTQGYDKKKFTTSLKSSSRILRFREKNLGLLEMKNSTN